MTLANLSQEVRRFILNAVTSVPHLEALLLFRNNPEALWDAEELAQRLYINRLSADDLLIRLHDSGFIAEAGNGILKFRYQPKTPHQSTIVEQVADAYANHLIAVTNLIHSNSASQAQQFADAFKLKKDQK